MSECGEGRHGELRATMLEALVGELRRACDVGRCTLRLDILGELYPVVHEARSEGARSLIGDTTVGLQGQPVVEALLAGAAQVVQPEARMASDDPGFQSMLDHYGMEAQIVTAVRDGERLLGMISLHELRAPRDWSAEELALARNAAALVAALLSVEAT